MQFHNQYRNEVLDNFFILFLLRVDLEFCTIKYKVNKITYSIGVSSLLALDSKLKIR
ncbi:hypothetical protein RchiOBHm_CPg0502041 (chloroplast) [Rosa chinensis]|uniref:Uncharacterized protein n=1 Tax=Rosa chinensis TaxID=74649 RepID=A0A2P6P190_ROSCH|nr:hypothetical protein RchiOBHm_CPg0502041 [Rosa chinensis]